MTWSAAMLSCSRCSIVDADDMAGRHATLQQVLHCRRSCHAGGGAGGKKAPRVLQRAGPALGAEEGVYCDLSGARPWALPVRFTGKKDQRIHG